MAERLTTNQEVPGSTPGWIDFLRWKRSRPLLPLDVLSPSPPPNDGCLMATLHLKILLA